MRFVMRQFLAAAMVLALGSTFAGADAAQPALTLAVGEVQHLAKPETAAAAAKWTSSDPQTLAVFPGGWVAGLKPGTARLADMQLVVKEIEPPLVDPATLKQFPDSRRFEMNGRKCYGSELNGQRADDPGEHANLVSNRVINPTPLRPDKKLEWAVQDGTEIFDGAGVLMGTVAPELSVDGRKVPSSMFNFGMSKVLNGRLCVYAFSVPIRPSPQVQKLIDPQELNKDGTVDTSAWLPLDRVTDQSALLDRIGLGKVKLPRLPLEKTRYRITGGNPKQYFTDAGELAIVKDLSGPVPSHYLRRPSRTVNILYSVPGYGLGGQGMDSFLISDGMIFRPAQGAKVFVQPTYFPKGHPQQGKVSPKTMTFLYGAVEVKGSGTVYGWVAKEALTAQ